MLCALALVSCSEYRESNDPSLHLAFSADTISFDTVFTEQGSATAQLMIYNRYGSAITINRVWLENGEVFLVNIDGEQDLSRLTHMTINGGDSAFVFIRVRMAALNSSSPVLVEDILHFHLTNGNTQNVRLVAYGQDAERIGRKGCGRTEKGDFVFTADKPYIIYDTLVVGGALTMNPGARIYMHQGACIYALGDVNANGTLDQPILIRGDRLDNLFDSVPYLYAGGSWNGFYLHKLVT